MTFASPHEVVGRGQGWGRCDGASSRQKSPPRPAAASQHDTFGAEIVVASARTFSRGFSFSAAGNNWTLLRRFRLSTSKLVIEIDGGQHGMTSRIERDLKRAAYLERNGYRVRRFWNNDVRENIDGVLMVICDALQKVRTPPTLDPSPPQAGGGETMPPAGGGESMPQAGEGESMLQGSLPDA